MVRKEDIKVRVGKALLHKKHLLSLLIILLLLLDLLDIDV